MEPEKLDNYNNFHNFLKIQKELIESCSTGVNFSKSTMQLDEMFQFLNDHFEEFHQKENFRVILAFIHRCLKVWVSREDYLEDDIGMHLVNLMAKHRDEESDINVLVQIVYQVMNSIKYFGIDDVLISEKLMHELIATVPLIENRTLASNCIVCIQKYLEMFPKRRENLETLWTYLKDQLEINLKSGLTKDVEIDILMQLIDDFKSLQAYFHEEPILISTIQHLLTSDQKKFRKCGYYLLKKLFQYANENINAVAKTWMSSHHIQLIGRSWIIYGTILENLEEEQSHLILPSLENLEELVKNKHLPLPWLNILYIRILTHNNILVIRWCIEFFLKTFTCSDLSAEILKHLLQATNTNLLFNYEGYFLNSNYFSMFLQGDVTSLLTMFPEIVNWKSVPLYMWLVNLNKVQLPKSITFKEILNISSCVRKLQNRTIREKAIEESQFFFKDYIQEMSMKEYVSYIETIYNSSDEYSEHEIFFSKKSSLVQSTMVECSIFKQRFYEIFTNSIWDNNQLLSFLSDIPVEQHGWLKFAPFKLELADCNRNCINNLYKLDLNLLEFCDIHKVINIFKNTLLDSPPYDKHELFECTQAAISFYIYQRPNFDMDDEDTLRFILNTGINHYKVLQSFAEKLLDNAQQQIDLWFIDELLKYDNKNMLECVSRYLCKVHDENVVKKYATSILETSNFDKNIFRNINLLKQTTDEWFKLLPSQGDKRIEDSFLFHHFKSHFMSRRLYCEEQIQLYCDDQFILDLLKYHSDITKKKPRYFENSNEHRVKLRIAICIYHYLFQKTNKNEDVLDQIWNIVLNENNQLNIIYIYELILGKKEFRENVILNKLKEAQNLTSSQQVSIISVAYTYFETNTTSQEVRNTMVYNLLSLTMGANFQTRMLAQMSLYQLLKNKFEKTECWQRIIQSIEDATGKKLPEYLNDIRLHISVLCKKFSAIYLILYITNAPFDEMCTFSILNYPEFRCEYNQIEYCRKRYLEKFNTRKNENTAPKITINDQIQRKMNPVEDLTESPNLIVYPVKENSAEMFVVASLIDKLPNLGGIARTCEVLGIKNLVMDSKIHTEKSDFKNLSMTAEKTLNMLEVKPRDLNEFLLLKKLEGFNIVGAEQTCNSQSFSNFHFPEKCVLLLGHEKDGIPAPLLGLLDNVVEIPQFGRVRSLNVHVTGALFMWEYCKQHLMPK